MKNCLVLIDLQNGFKNNNTEVIFERIKSFISNNRFIFDHIVVTRYVNNPNTACYKFEGWKDCMEGSQESELVDWLKNNKTIEKVFDKSVYSCFNDEFKNYLKDKNINKVYFVGVNTDCCVLHSVLDCYNSVIDCSIIKDLCGSTLGKESHDCAIHILNNCITKERVVSIQDILSFL